MRLPGGRRRCLPIFTRRRSTRPVAIYPRPASLSERRASWSWISTARRNLELTADASGRGEKKRQSSAGCWIRHRPPWAPGMLRELDRAARSVSPAAIRRASGRRGGAGGATPSAREELILALREVTDLERHHRPHRLRLRQRPGSGLALATGLGRLPKLRERCRRRATPRSLPSAAAGAGPDLTDALGAHAGAGHRGRTRLFTVREGGMIRDGLQRRGGPAARHPDRRQGPGWPRWRPGTRRSTGIQQPEGRATIRCSAITSRWPSA